MQRTALILFCACALTRVVGTAAAAPPSIRVTHEPREAVYLGKNGDYRIALALNGYSLLEWWVAGRLYCVRSGGEEYLRHFKFRLGLAMVVGHRGRFSFTKRPTRRGVKYGVDRALKGHVGPLGLIPGSFSGHYEYVVRRPRVTCQTNSFHGSAEAPFSVRRVTLGNDLP
jgi:hypothetical protein